MDLGGSRDAARRLAAARSERWGAARSLAVARRERWAATVSKRLAAARHEWWGTTVSRRAARVIHEVARSTAVDGSKPCSSSPQAYM
jgi:hypothetical protein